MTDARGPFADFFGRLWRQKPLGIASGIVILILILLAIFADVLAPYPFDQIIVVLGIAGGVGGSRVVRGAVVATKGNDFFWPPGRSARRRDRSWCAMSCPISWRP